MQPKLRMLAALTVALTLFQTLSFAQPGSLNTSFGNTGLIKQRFHSNSNTVSETAFGIANLADGKSLVALSVLGKAILTRITSTGSIDSTFAKDGYSEYVSLFGNSLALAADGSVFIAGFRNNDFCLVHFDAKGTLDSSFGINGVVKTSFNDKIANVQALSIQPDGKIVLVGHVYNGANYDIALARYNSDGSLDASFGSGGKVTTDFGYHDRGAAITIQTDGKVLVSGSIAITNVINNIALVRYNVNGSLDTSFGNSGKVLFPQNISQPANCVKVQPDGNILVAGGDRDFVLLRYKTDGSHDLTFGNNGVIQTHFTSTFAYTRSIALLEDGKIILMGNLFDTPSKFTVGLVRYLPNGKIDSSFGDLGITAITFGTFSTRAEAVNIQQNGKITVLGSVTPTDGVVSDYALFRCEPNGVLDKDFGSNGLLTAFVDAEVSRFSSIAVQKDQKIVVGGSTSSTISPELGSAFALARYNLDGSLDPSFGKGGKVVRNFGLGDMINEIVILPDNKILAAGVTHIGPGGSGGRDFIFARFHSDGSLDDSFGQNGKARSAITSSNVNNLITIAIQNDNKILAGGSTSIKGIPNYILARYNQDGSLDSSFGQSGKVITNFGYESSSLVSIKVLQSGKILTLARAMNANNSLTDIVLAQYNSNGILDASFGNNGIAKTDFNANETGQSLDIQADSKIIVGGFIEFSSKEPDFTLLRYNADGSPDLSFGDRGKVITDFGFRDFCQSLSVQSNGKIILIGQSYYNDGSSNLSLARYNPNGILDTSFGQNGKVETDLKGDEPSFTKSIIIGNNLYVAGSIRQLSTYASIASYVLRVPVQLSCPSDVVSSINQGACSAVATNIDPIITPQNNDEKVNFKLTGATTGLGSGSVSGLAFNKGVTTVTYSLVEEPSITDSFTVTVNDTEAPKITDLSVNTNTLWPADNKMRDVVVSYTSTDNCGVPKSSILVTCNEEPGGPVSGNNSTDWEVVDEHLVRLRAERSGTGDGRIYSIKVTSTDESGNATTETITVSVPKKELDIKVSSNPTTTYFSLKFSGADMDQKATLRVMNSMGEIIEIINNVTLDQTLQIGSSYRPGLYIIELIQGSYREQVKVIKQ